MLRSRCLAFPLAAAVWACVSVPAHALISPVTAIDGPSADIVGVRGIAMADDGTGGLVYVKREADRTHIFAAQFVDGAWKPARRVDVGQQFDSTWPAIGAGDGGRLLVSWVQDFGPTDRMFAASLAPGARRFEAPVPVDMNVGDATLGTFPALSMARGGQAYLAYRVITDAQPATAPPGTVLGEIRVARFTGQFWSGYGAPLNRNPASPQRAPTAENGPRIGTDAAGNAVLAWQEADDNFIDRIYARRIFGSSYGIALPVSPQEWGGKPLRGPADQLSLDVFGFGEAAIGFRQQPGEGSALAGTRVMVAQTADVFSSEAARFAVPRLVDGSDDATAPPPPGPVEVAQAKSGYATAFAREGAVVAGDGDDRTVNPPQILDRASSSAAPQPKLDVAASDAAAFAWVRQDGNRGSVSVRERRSDGVATDRSLSAPRGGAVTALLLDGSGLGDALIGFQQGTGAGTQIAAATLDAPPDVFTVQAPLEFTRAEEIELRWDASLHAVGGVTYTVTIDDDTIRDGLRTLRLPIDTTDLDDGVRIVQVVATDSNGQETTSVPAELKLDRTPPRVRVRTRRRSVTVDVSDGREASVAGMEGGRTAIAFGDGARSTAQSAQHRYRRAGTYRVVVRVRDAVGNAQTVRRRVRIR